MKNNFKPHQIVWWYVIEHDWTCIHIQRQKKRGVFVVAIITVQSICDIFCFYRLTMLAYNMVLIHIYIYIYSLSLVRPISAHILYGSVYLYRTKWFSHSLTVCQSHYIYIFIYIKSFHTNNDATTTTTPPPAHAHFLVAIER